ncbi:hypothetical protein LWI29_026048 [Acer saccharum]|uniref:Endonuclease/exonuclease/phosphatase domain-containing protein n=1 Tax=Acer saccharum TaxID=4024 RepID=A0AA39SEL0_ACESA|nr:hypothetical protein LWI29_026048 [Acer saccharum]
MSFCTWNVRGAGKKGFPKIISDLRNIYKFDVIAILEPRISGSRALKVVNNLGFSDKFLVEASGFSGGIWLLWNSDRVKLQVVASSRHSITAIVAEGDRFWVLTIVYANPSVVTRRKLWGYLSAIRNCFKGPWVVMGDFNEITNSAKKRGGRGYFSNSGFGDWINENKLVDLGFIGHKYTWMTKRGVGEDIWVRLDRAICSVEWRVAFGEGYVRHLPRVSSDHCPIMLCLYSSHIPRGPFKPFRFEAMWLKHKEFDNVVRCNWGSHVGDLPTKLQVLSNNIKVWNKEVFGCIFHRKRRILARLLGIQRSLSERCSPWLASLEFKLRDEYEHIIEQEEIFWLQKTRNSWLKEGDRNTKFFHLSTLIRRRYNKLEGLKDLNGIWRDDRSSMVTIVVSYFENLFSNIPSSYDYGVLPNLFPRLDEGLLEDLNNPVSEEEVRLGLFGLSSVRVSCC